MSSQPSQKLILKSKPLFGRQHEIIKEILSENKRFNIINASRQFGKSTLAQNLILHYVFNEPKSKILYVSPTYSLGKHIYRTILEGLPTQFVTDQQKQELYIKFCSGSNLTIKSAVNHDHIRGGSYNFVVVDELSYMPDDAWQSSIRPTMNVIGKQAVLISTPRGKNLFYRLAEQGKSPEYKDYLYLFGHYSQNPFYNANEVIDAKKTLPERIFLQEYEAQFLDDGGSVFPNINELSIIKKFERSGSTKFFAGLDLGRLDDYTVLTILDSNGRVVEILRLNKLSWENIISQILSVLRSYNAHCVVEVNSIGDPIYEQLKRSYQQLTPFQTTNQSKQDLIEELILAFSSKNITIPTQDLFPELYRELSTFTFKYSQLSRKIIYGAIQGFHDDCVMSLAFANYARKLRKGGVSFAFVS